MEEKLLTDWLYEGSYEQPLAKPILICDDCDNEIYTDEYYYDTYIKTISLYKRKDYESRSIVGMTYRYLSMSDLGKFNGFAQAEDDNEFDDFAAAIYNDRGKHLGYIPRDDEEMHEYITDNFGSVNAYGYVAYSENEGYYGEVCIEYLPKDIIT